MHVMCLEFVYQGGNGNTTVYLRVCSSAADCLPK